MQFGLVSETLSLLQELGLWIPELSSHLEQFENMPGTSVASPGVDVLVLPQHPAGLSMWCGLSSCNFKMIFWPF